MSATVASPLQYYRTRQRTVQVVHPMESPRRGLPLSHSQDHTQRHRAVLTPAAQDSTQTPLLQQQQELPPHALLQSRHEESHDAVRQERDEYHRVILSMQDYIDELHGTRAQFVPTTAASTRNKAPWGGAMESQPSSSLLPPRGTALAELRHGPTAPRATAPAPTPQLPLVTAHPPPRAVSRHPLPAPAAGPAPSLRQSQRSSRSPIVDGRLPERTARSSSAQFWKHRHDELQAKCEALSRRLASSLCDQQRALLDATAEWQRQRAEEVAALHESLSAMDAALHVHFGATPEVHSASALGQNGYPPSVVEHCLRVADALHRHLASKPPRDVPCGSGDAEARLPFHKQCPVTTTTTTTTASSSSSAHNGTPLLVLEELSSTALSLKRLSTVRQALSDAARILFLSAFPHSSNSFAPPGAEAIPGTKAGSPLPKASEYVHVHDMDERDGDDDVAHGPKPAARHANANSSPFDELRRRMETGSIVSAPRHGVQGLDHTSPQVRSSLSSTASTVFEVHHTGRASGDHRDGTCGGGSSPSSAGLRSSRTSSSPSPPQTRPASRSASAQANSGNSGRDRRPEAHEVRCALDIIREALHVVDALISSQEVNRCTLECKCAAVLQSASYPAQVAHEIESTRLTGASGVMPPEQRGQQPVAAASSGKSSGEHIEFRGLTPPPPSVVHRHQDPSSTSFDGQVRLHAPPRENDTATPLMIEEVEGEFDPTVETNFVEASESEEERSEQIRTDGDGGAWTSSRRPPSPPVLSCPPPPGGVRRVFVVSPSADDDDHEVTSLVPRFSASNSLFTTLRGTETPLSVTWGNGTSANSSVLSERRRAVLSPVN